MAGSWSIFGLIIRLYRMLLNSLRVGQASLPVTVCERPRSHRRQAQGVELLQNEDGGTSKKTRAARQAGTPVLLIQEEGAGESIASRYRNRRPSHPGRI